LACIAGAHDETQLYQVVEALHACARLSGKRAHMFLAAPTIDQEQHGAMALRQPVPPRRQLGLASGAELRLLGESLGRWHGA
jgi:hypothetical protein